MVDKPVMSIHKLDDHDTVVIGVLKTHMIDGQAVSLLYKGEKRMVESHAIGMSAKGLPVVRAFDLDKQGWRLFGIDAIEDVYPVGMSEGPREAQGYVKGDKHMTEIYHEL